MSTAQAGEVVQLVDQRGKSFIIRLAPDDTLQTHRGVLPHADLIGREYGSQVRSHLGHVYLLLQPSTDDLIRNLRRNSQIIYPKDLGLILMKLSVRPGQSVLEAGSGSGALTTVLAHAVGPTGRVVSYDVRPDMQNLARKNVERLGLAERVTFKLRDIALGFDETDQPALFLDVPNPWDYIGQAYQALQGGGFFGSLVPTANQVSDLLVALQREQFGFVEVCEVLLRYYKPAPQRLRPADRMVAHTGFLIFARRLSRDVTLPPPGPEDPDAQGPGDAPE